VLTVLGESSDKRLIHSGLNVIFYRSLKLVFFTVNGQQCPTSWIVGIYATRKIYPKRIVRVLWSIDNITEMLFYIMHCLILDTLY